jgi:hypothetical protein
VPGKPEVNFVRQYVAESACVLDRVRNSVGLTRGVGHPEVQRIKSFCGALADAETRLD